MSLLGVEVLLGVVSLPHYSEKMRNQSEPYKKESEDKLEKVPFTVHIKKADFGAEMGRMEEHTEPLSPLNVIRLSRDPFPHQLWERWHHKCSETMSFNDYLDKAWDESNHSFDAF
jgi:hypothetical protein